MAIVSTAIMINNRYNLTTNKTAMSLCQTNNMYLCAKRNEKYVLIYVELLDIIFI